MIAGQFVIALVVLPFVWHPVEVRHWPLLGALAVLNLLGQLGLVRAFSLAPPSAIAPYEYTALLWAAALGFLVFGDVPSGAPLGRCGHHHRCGYVRDVAHAVHRGRGAPARPVGVSELSGP